MLEKAVFDAREDEALLQQQLDGLLSLARKLAEETSMQPRP